MTDPGLSYQQLTRVFPFFLAFDTGMVVTSFGPSLAKLIPDLKKGGRVDWLFKLKRPVMPLNRDTIKASEGKMVLLTHQQVLLRGQFELGSQILFLGSPVFESLQAMKRSGIQIQDYAAHDPQSDMIQRLSLEKIALTEARDLAAKLEEANQSLKYQFDDLTSLKEQLKVIFDNSVYGILTLNQTGEIQLFNKAAEALFGYRAAEIIGQPATRLIEDHTNEPFWQNTGRGEAQGIHKSGDRITLRVSTGKAQDLQGSIYIVMVHDISEQKETEQRFIAVSSRLSAMIRNFPHGILVEDEHRRVALTNSAFVKMFGMDSEPEDLEGVDCGLTETPDPSLFKKTELYQLITHTLLEHRQPSVNEIHELQDGRILSRSFIPIYSGDLYLGNLWQYQDITANKNIEYAIKDSEKRMRAVLDTALDAILSIDQKGQVVDWNHAAVSLFGWQKSEVLGKPLEEIIIPKDSRKRFKVGLRRLKADKTLDFNRRTEIQALHKTGRMFPCELAVTTLKFEESNLFTAFMRDISDRVKVEKALKSAKDAAESASQAKSEFLARMSHEMRTPLNVVLGMITLTTDSNQDPDIAENLTTAARSGEQLLFLINDFLDQSKIESGLMQIESIPFDLAEMIQNVNNLMSTQANKKQIEFSTEVHTGAQTGFEGDPNRITQILINLTSNAIKFTDQGSVRLIVESQELDQTHHLLFRVLDTGKGIPPEKQPHIFEQFYQVDPANKPKSGGTGLGLAICQSLANLMGGKVWLHQSIPQKGSELRCLIPANPTEIATPKKRTIHHGSKIRARILLADDNRVNLKVAREILTRQGHWVISAHGGEEAIKAFRSTPFDTVFLDLEMPDRNGFVVTDHIKTWEQKNRDSDTPIIALTAHVLEETRNQCIQAGMKGFIGKPVIPDELDAIIKKWVCDVPMIVLVDDDPDAIHILMTYVANLKNTRCFFFNTGREAIRFIEKGGIDLIVCDYHLSDMLGSDLAHQVRASHDVPILFYSGLDKEMYQHKVKDLDTIAFLTKPVRKQRFLNKVLDMAPHLQVNKPKQIEVEVDPELITLAHSYLENRKASIKQLSDWVANGEFKEIKRIGHNVKGTAGTYGFDELSEIAHGLEIAAEAEDPERIKALIIDMTRYLAQVEILEPPV